MPFINSIHKHFYYYFLVLLFLISISPALSHASTAVSPILIEEDITVGQSVTKKFKVTNNDSEAHTYYLQLKDIKDVGPGGVPIFAEYGEPSGFELSSWLKPSVSSFRVPAGKTFEFTLSINVPSINVSPGVHLGGVVISRTPPNQSEVGQGSVVGYEVVTLISLDLAGDKFSSAQLYEFNTDSFLYGHPRVNFNLVVGNLGNTLVRPSGIIIIKDMFGKERGRLDVNRNSAGIIPGGRREFKVDWTGETLTFGKHIATVALSYGSDSDGRQSLSGRTSFWILPMNIIGPALGGLLLVSLSLFVLARLYVRRQLRGVVRGHGQRSSRLAVMSLAATIFLIAFLLLLFYLFA